MHVLLLGATGTIGDAVLTELLDHGHDVTAPVRSEAKAAAVDEPGGTGVVLDFADRARLVYLMEESDAVVQLAADAEDSEGFDRAVAEAAVEALAGTGKPYVHTGGVWMYGSGEVDERDPLDPPAMSVWRTRVAALLESADLTLTLIDPGVVYGHGQGLHTLVTDGPRDGEGRLVLIGDGAQHWTTIHVDDLAALYVAVVEAGGGFGHVLGVGGDSPSVADIAAASGARVVAEDEDATRRRLGDDFAEALLLDQRASGAKARTIGGWRPTRPSLLDELRA